MRAEIEALLIAYREEQAKEQKLVSELLTALAEMSVNRQRSFEQILAATNQLGGTTGQPAAGLDSLGQPEAQLADGIEQALNQLRRNDGNVSHH